MRQNKIYIITVIAFFILNSQRTVAQIWVENLSKHPAIKTKGIYVVLNDTTSDINKAYWNIYKKYWTYSKIIFLPYADMDNHLIAGNYFFTLMREKNVQRKKYTSAWPVYNGYFLQLWTYTGKSKPDSLKKEHILNGLLFRHVTNLGKAFLFSTEKPAYYRVNAYDYSDKDLPTLKFYSDCSYDGVYKNGDFAFFNWGKGLLKNYLQLMSWYAEQNSNIGRDDIDIYEKEKMDVLKKDTLFIPDYALTQYATLNEIPTLISHRQNEKIPFKKYKYPIKVISREELDRKLLNDKKPFFYFSYIVYWKDKMISIIYSATGEKVYYTWSSKGDYSGLDLKEIKLQSIDIEILCKKMEQP